MELKYYVFYKPYNVLTQFTKEREDHHTLAQFLKVEKDVYPVGRLDKDSEGLLILTNDKSLNDHLLNPDKKHVKTYLVQVENDINSAAIDRLTKGIDIKLDKGMYHTLPCFVKRLSKAPLLPDRSPPVRYRAHIPDSWARIELTEGKNRQIRKMFAAVGFPVLRLVRVQIENLKIGKLSPGNYVSISQKDLYHLLNIDQDIKLHQPKTEMKKPSSKISTPKAKSTFKEFRGKRNKKNR